jgi:FkbM family methyltransferase
MQKLMKRALVGSLWTVMGRRNLVRLGRFLSNEGRLDVQDDLHSNGEQIVQEIALRFSPAGRKLVMLDVGANLGDWTKSTLQAARSCGVAVEVHAFEPCGGTLEMFHRNLAGEQDSERRVVAVKKGLSNQAGSATLNVVGDGYGNNSLHAVPMAPVSRRDTIELDTVDDYCRRANISHITLIKTDTEGHDLSVAEGAIKSLESGSIDLIQFEYNASWVCSRRFIRDAFELFSPYGYALGKVTPRGIEFYQTWHPELETFRQTNYLACRNEWVQRFPRIRWWNEG